MTLLIAVSTCYLFQTFWRSTLSATNIVLSGNSIYHVYSHSRGISCCTTQFMVINISYGFSEVSTKELNVCSWQDIRLTVSRLDFFFLRTLEVFFFLIRPSAFSITSIHFANADKKLERNLRFDLNGLIKHFVSKV